MYKAALLAGVAVGYVLGARAGRGRYDRIAMSVRSLLDQPTVQETAGVLQGQAEGLASAARQTVTSRVSSRLRPAPAAAPGPVVQPYGEPTPGTPAAGGFGTDTSTGPDLTLSTEALDADPRTGSSPGAGF